MASLLIAPINTHGVTNGNHTPEEYNFEGKLSFPNTLTSWTLQQSLTASASSYYELADAVRDCWPVYIANLHFVPIKVHDTGLQVVIGRGIEVFNTTPLVAARHSSDQKKG